MISPVLLNSGVLTVLAGQSLELDQSRMGNPFRSAMLIDEVRFKANDISQFGNYLTIRAQLSLGRIPITRGFVPISCFGRVQSDVEGGLFYCWKLPKPLYVPRDELLVTKVLFDTRYGTGALASVPVEVSYAGRSLDRGYPIPDMISIPWVTHFDIPLLVFTSGNSDLTISTQAEILNPFDKLLHVQRFIGRTLRIDAAQDKIELGENGRGDQGATQMTMVRAHDSLGNILVRDPTPFPHLFQYLDRSWTVNTRLPPKGFYIFEVARDYTATATGTSFAHAISMVAHREVELQ